MKWNEADRDRDYLLSGARLDAYEQWAATATMRLTVAEQAFIGAGGDRRDDTDREQLTQEADTRRSARRRLWALAAVVVVLVGVVGAVFLASREADPVRVAAFGPLHGSSALEELADAGFARAERDLGVEVEQMDDLRFSDLEAEYRALGDSGTDLVILDSATATAPWLRSHRATPKPRSSSSSPIWIPNGRIDGLLRKRADRVPGRRAAALLSETGIIGYIGAIQVPSLEACELDTRPVRRP